MFVIGVCQHSWGRVYFGYGKDGMLYMWVIDRVGQYGLQRTTSRYMNSHFIND